MKRDFDEISEEEWSQHSFNPSRVLKRPRTPKRTTRPGPANPSPPIESFAYRRPSKVIGRRGESNSSDNCVEVEDLGESDSEVKKTANGEDLLLDDEEVGEAKFVVRAARVGRRFVVEDEEASEDEFDDEVDISSSEDEGVGGGGGGGGEEDEDVVGKALQKCAKISADLRKELYGSSSGATTCDRYSEVETSTVRIVTQTDIDEACKAEDSDFQPILKPYQLVGVNFLLLLYKKGIEGILADEMGLGKTIQAITYLTLLNRLNNDPGPHLVVCPASVLENWERELRKWCPSFTVLQYHGAARAAYSRELNSLSRSGKPPPFNVLLVCYSLFERHEQQKDDRKVLKRWRWSCVLMDEAHALKDKNSYRWKNLMSVARNANQRLMLTGTPLQNDLHELWSLLEFMLPDIFTTENVDLKKLLNAEDTELITRMKSILGPFILRRLKSDVMQQLVPKIQRVEYVIMEKKQENTYKEAIEEYRAASQARLSKLSSKSLNSLAKALPKRQISNYFTQFRKIANHPLLIRRIYSDEDVIRIARKLHPIGAFGFECSLERVIEELKSYNDFRIHQLLFQYAVNDTKGTLSDKHVMLSAKCRTLAELLPSMKKSGHRVLIFSQWTSMLDILEWTLDVIGVTYRRLDGTQVTDRQTIVDTFNNDKSIFACLLSTRAGGQGLNLTGADTVIIHDMDFNPQIDRQAEDRCHRIGQTKPVTIFLVTKSTVDENIYEIAKRKLVLDAAVLESGVHVEDDGDAPEKTMGEILASLLMG
uniref:Uncharacterized protein n=1 Tax=Schrenkiella parvula TaxID=98039 RepID=E5F712_9BRAS|nr:unknown [Schrenkiella parvula]